MRTNIPSTFCPRNRALANCEIKKSPRIEFMKKYKEPELLRYSFRLSKMNKKLSPEEISNCEFSKSIVKEYSPEKHEGTIVLDSIMIDANNTSLASGAKWLCRNNK